jgi:hypothetical protein
VLVAISALTIANLASFEPSSIDLPFQNVYPVREKTHYLHVQLSYLLLHFVVSACPPAAGQTQSVVPKVM